MTIAPPTVAVDGTIVSAEAWLSDLEVETVRTDAVQSFLKQETIFVRLRTAGGVEGIGYSYTIWTGGEAVRDGHGVAPDAPGLGIAWDFDAIDDRRVA